MEQPGGDGASKRWEEGKVGEWTGRVQRSEKIVNLQWVRLKVVELPLARAPYAVRVRLGLAVDLVRDADGAVRWCQLPFLFPL